MNRVAFVIGSTFKGQGCQCGSSFEHRRPRLRNRYFLASDVALLMFAGYLSFVLRLDSFVVLGRWLDVAVFAILTAVAVPVLFYRAGLYTRYWPYASVEEVPMLCLAVAALDATATAGYMIAAAWQLPGISVLPRSIPAIFFLLGLTAVAGPRLGVRLLASMIDPRHAPNRRVTTAVVGAGDAGVLTVRELRRNPHLGIEVIGFLDDDPSKHGMRIHGVPVLGSRHDLIRVVRDYGIERLVIAMPTAPGRVIREIVDLCGHAGLTPQIVPGLFELIDGAVQVDRLRRVEIDDLLRREPIETDLAAVTGMLRGKRVLITGAGGSIGSELSRQVLRCQPKELILLGHGETSIFAIHGELRRMITSVGLDDPPVLTPVIADIRFPGRLRSVFDGYQPEVVFHAAAHKHVPLMELSPSEAVANNVVGTRNVLDAARRTGVGLFVLVSTDKAVNPTSVMGATKRVAELLVHQAARETGQAYLVVRFGNVLGSRGSVVLTMKEQIASGGPVTVTHPDMTRYFMTIPEAVQLILQASVLGRGGEVFVFDMGEPVRIVDLARDLIHLTGREVGEDIEIVFTGPRPGEKLFEELFLPEESYEQTAHEKIVIAANASHHVPPDLDAGLAALETAVVYNNEPEVLNALEWIVPEYQQDREKRIAHEVRSAGDTDGRPATAMVRASGPMRPALSPYTGMSTPHD